MNQPATALSLRFRALDGWRGIAAMLVAVYHSPFYGHFYAVPLVRNAYLFVDLFFVLSGFVISYAYRDRLGNAKSVVAFLIRRFGRIWPLHAIVLAVFVAIEVLKLVGFRHGLALHDVPFAGDHGVGAIIANVALLHAFGIYDYLTWNGPSWSISVEFWTYGAFAGVCFLVPRRSLALAILITVLAPIAIFSLSKHSPIADVTYDYGILRCLFGFSVGHFTYRLFGNRATSCGPQWVDSWWPTIAEGGAVVGMAGFVSGAGNGVATIAAPFVFAAAIYVFAHESGVISRLLRSKLARRLGDWSYSIYMTHVLIITVLIELCRMFEKITGTHLLYAAASAGAGVFAPAFPHSALLGDGLTLFCLVVTVAFAALTFRFIEVPGRGYFAGLADRLRGTRMPAAVGQIAALQGTTPTGAIPTILGQIAPLQGAAVTRVKVEVRASLHGAATTRTEVSPPIIGPIDPTLPDATILAVDT